MVTALVESSTSESETAAQAAVPLAVTPTATRPAPQSAGSAARAEAAAARPLRPAVMVPAEKSPLGSRATMAPAVLALAAEWAPLPARAAWVKRAPLWTGLVEADTAEESTRAVWQLPEASVPRQRKPEPALVPSPCPGMIPVRLEPSPKKAPALTEEPVVM